MNTTTRLFPAFLALSLLGACTGDGCEALGYPVLESGALYVAAACGVGSEEGTQQAPFATITAALKAAKDGQTISVASGVYRESLSLGKGVRLVGAGRDAVQIQPDAGRGIQVSGSGAVRVESLSVVGAQFAGIGSSGAPLLLKDVEVRKTSRPKDPVTGLPLGGNGVEVTGGGALTLEGCVISGNQGTGVIAHGGGAVSIIDPAFIIDPSYMPRSADHVGIIDPAFSVGAGSVISGNRKGGVAIIDPSYGPANGKADDASDVALSVRGALLDGNWSFGIVLYGASASLQAVGVANTRQETSEDDGHGLVVVPGLKSQAPVHVDIDDKSVFAGGGGSGLLVSSTEKIAIDVDSQADVSGNVAGGVWVGGKAATLRLGAKTRLSRNHMLGAAATGGARLEATGAHIEDTQPKMWGPPAGGLPVPIADGVGFFEGGRGRLTGVAIASMQRAAVIVVGGGDKAGNGELDLTFDQLQVSGSKYGLVVNGGGAKASSTLQEAAAQGSASSVATAVKVDAAEPVWFSPCSQSDASADCRPAQPAVAAVK